MRFQSGRASFIAKIGLGRASARVLLSVAWLSKKSRQRDFRQALPDGVGTAAFTTLPGQNSRQTLVSFSDCSSESLGDRRPLDDLVVLAVARVTKDLQAGRAHFAVPTRRM